jgi:hypothetical protein
MFLQGNNLGVIPGPIASASTYSQMVQTPIKLTAEGQHVVSNPTPVSEPTPMPAPAPEPHVDPYDPPQIVPLPQDAYQAPEHTGTTRISIKTPTGGGGSYIVPQSAPSGPAVAPDNQMYAEDTVGDGGPSPWLVFGLSVASFLFMAFKGGK